jgi:hypothetical protein
MRKTFWNLVLSVGLMAFRLGSAVAQDDVRSANFYSQVSDGECGLEFTIAYRGRTAKGSIAFLGEGGWRLRGTLRASWLLTGSSLKTQTI